ncbi:hypothetical protein MICAK_560002 [Microcystis aeruginosa PCC 9701]|uniref:Uncharacterized protein n=1 Tax=Microcystis aeruginosa PCC 9701 TaxID=721123 RepID=I4IWK1_MICAE|nr:hypothetical protein MICAK_560002 [Microcystis aeruginosa PCC 9701]
MQSTFTGNLLVMDKIVKNFTEVGQLKPSPKLTFVTVKNWHLSLDLATSFNYKN